MKHRGKYLALSIILIFNSITFAADSHKGKGRQPDNFLSAEARGDFLEVLGLEGVESFKNVPRSMEELEKLSAEERARLLDLLPILLILRLTIVIAPLIFCIWRANYRRQIQKWLHLDS